jgi:hypothetical protein
MQCDHSLVEEMSRMSCIGFRHSPVARSTAGWPSKFYCFDWILIKADGADDEGLGSLRKQTEWSSKPCDPWMIEVFAST